MTRRSRTLLCTALVLCWAPATAAQAPQNIAGHWEGTGDIVVNWTTQRTLRIVLDVATDGSVTGTVGDAEFRGKLAKNRGALGRALRMKTDWVIRGDLSGPVIKAEQVERKGANVLFDVVNDSTWDAGIHTTGTKAGGAKSMIFSVAHLTLRRSAPPPRSP